MVAIGLVFVGTESTISHELATTQKGDVRVGLQENGSDSTALRDYPLAKEYAYRLQVKVEGINQEEVNVTSTADTPSGISVAIGFQLIDTHFDTKTIYVYLYGNHSTDVSSFNTCGVKLDGTKVCANSIMEGELVLLNFNALR